MVGAALGPAVIAIISVLQCSSRSVWVSPSTSSASTLGGGGCLEQRMTMEVDSEALLSSRVEGAPASSHDRATAEYHNHSERFVIPQAKRAYKQQYAQLYFTRLKLLEKRVRTTIAAEAPSTPVVRSLDLETGVECILIGTLYKDMCLKPSVLAEYTKVSAEKSLVKSRVSESDSLVLEDENSRVFLVGDALDVGQLITGVVCGVLGTAEESGDFVVRKLFFAAPLSAAVPRTPLPTGGPRKLVALVSGLQVGGSVDPVALQLLLDHLAGLSGGSAEQQQCAEVVRVVIAGESSKPIAPPVAKAGKKVQFDAAGNVRELDQHLAQLAAAIPVDVMPGATDLTNVSLPQQPLHPCLFPLAAAFSSFQRVTNPYDFSLGGTDFLGTSGQTVDDLTLYTSIEDRLDVMEATLRWQHLAPSAPDTLAMYPFADEDPFIVERAPAVYFVGNQPSFCTRMVTLHGTPTRLITLPAFAASGMVVLLDLDTLEVEPLVFSSDALATPMQE